jgi:dTDP-4-amino-4,6-dideoxygalactose transaminase
MVKEPVYNPWPSGLIPEHLQRPELKQLKEAGYEYEDPRQIIGMFEQKVADFAGCKYAVATDCCTHALELCLRFQISKGELSTRSTVFIPANTYISVYWMLKQLGLSVRFEEKEWYGEYNIEGTEVWDSAVMWKRNIFGKDDVFKCLSFQIKKTIPIGRGGMVLTNDKEAADFIRFASYDGRNLTVPYDHPEHIKGNGYHYYLSPEDAGRGILLMDQIKTETKEPIGWENYPDIRKMLKIQ